MKSKHKQIKRFNKSVKESELFYELLKEFKTLKSEIIVILKEFHREPRVRPAGFVINRQKIKIPHTFKGISPIPEQPPDITILRSKKVDQLKAPFTPEKVRKFRDKK